MSKIPAIGRLPFLAVSLFNRGFLPERQPFAGCRMEIRRADNSSVVTPDKPNLPRPCRSIGRDSLPFA